MRSVESMCKLCKYEAGKAPRSQCTTDALVYVVGVPRTRSFWKERMAASPQVVDQRAVKRCKFGCGANTYLRTTDWVFTSRVSSMSPGALPRRSRAKRGHLPLARTPSLHRRKVLVSSQLTQMGAVAYQESLRN